MASRRRSGIRRLVKKHCSGKKYKGPRKVKSPTHWKGVKVTRADIRAVCGKKSKRSHKKRSHKKRSHKKTKCLKRNASKSKCIKRSKPRSRR